MLSELSQFFPLCPLPPAPLFPSAMSLLSSCPWVVHISSLASPFPIQFLTSPCLFCTYHLGFLCPVSLSPFLLPPPPTDNPPCDLHFCEPVPVLVVCLVHFCCFFFFFLGSVVNSCEFVVILVLIFLIFFLNKSL